MELEAKRRRLEEEAKKKGNLSVTQIQGILQNAPKSDEVDWVQEIQELKQQLTMEIRKNHVLERDLAKLDKRIGLLIRNRGEVEPKKEKKDKKKDKNPAVKVPDFSTDPKKVEAYQELFYLLQAESRYVAKLVYLVNMEEVQHFLDTVLITLYGAAFSPREEYLLLRLLQASIKNEMQVIKDIRGFIQAETVVPKMIITYNKRKQGAEYLKEVLGPLVKKVIEKGALNLDLNPKLIYQKLITETEIRTGKPSDLPRNVSEEQAMKHPDVQKAVSEHLAELESVCTLFLDGIISSRDKLPYGLRWICKALKGACETQFPDATQEDIHRLLGYFIYYRFINIAIVAPDTFGLVESKDISPEIRGGLTDVAKVLQNLFNLLLFTDPEKGYMFCVNQYIEASKKKVEQYLDKVVDVKDPEEFLEVDQYMELVQRIKPVIVISTHEIVRIHTMVEKHLNKLAPEQDDNLRVIMKDLGPIPPLPDTEKDIQLWLSNRFKQDVPEDPEEKKLFNATKELVLPVLRQVPIEQSIRKLNLMDVLESGIKHAAATNNRELSQQINRILENIQKLEGYGLVTKEDNYESFVHAVALEVANRAAIRENQRKEISRLNAALSKLRQHQGYIKDQIRDYNSYLQGARKAAYSQDPKSKKKKAQGEDQGRMGPFKFTYKVCLVFSFWFWFWFFFFSSHIFSLSLSPGTREARCHCGFRSARVFSQGLHVYDFIRLLWCFQHCRQDGRSRSRANDAWVGWFAWASLQQCGDSWAWSSGTDGLFFFSFFCLSHDLSTDAGCQYDYSFDQQTFSGW